jgi:DNA (cytosine-5)-methyltransferase 1
VGIEITPIGGVYTSVSPAFQRGVYKNYFRGLKAEAHDSGVAFKVEVKEASPDLTVYAVWYPKEKCYIAIRKLTPKECFRLQGWTDDYFEKAQLVNSDSQLYKQAGNGVTVNVIRAIANKMEVENAYRDDC